MKELGNKFKSWVFMMWRPLLAFLVITLIVGSTLGFQLGSLTKGASKSEHAYINSVTSGKKLLENPVYAVHKIPVYVLFKLDINRLSAYRAVSALFTTIAAVSFFFILREWYKDRVAALGAWLFLASAWVLHVGRLATPEASYLLVVPLLWTAIWLYNTTLRKSALLLLSFLGALGLYIPGVGWLILLAIAWKHKLLWNELKQVPWWYRSICLSVIVITLAPLFWASQNSIHVLVAAAGLPAHVPNFSELGQNLLNIPTNLFFKGPDDPSKWLGRLPLLDGFSTIMLIIGAYSLRYHYKIARTQLLVGSILLIVLFITLGGPVTITALIPLVYFLITAGVAFMLQQWFTVFPHNPVARTLATTLLSVVILLVSFYHINHYFIAWPQTPATKQAFTSVINNRK